MLALRLRIAREMNNMMQKDAAQKVGISNVTLSQYEKGIRKPDPDTLKKLADVYDVAVDWLLGRIDNPHPDKYGDKPSDEQLIEALFRGGPKRNLTEQEAQFLKYLIQKALKDGNEEGEGR